MHYRVITDSTGGLAILFIHDKTLKRMHCKNIWVILVTSCDKLQTSRDASNLIESLSVVEKLFSLLLS